MKVAIGCDHGGYNLKSQIVEQLTKAGVTIVDVGTNSTDSVDYPDFALACAKEVVSGNCEYGIVVCTSGIGISIAANKVKGIRCGLCFNTDMAINARRHNNCNMLAIGQKHTDKELAFEIVASFLNSPFEGQRHSLRVDKITEIENNFLGGNK